MPQFLKRLKDMQLAKEPPDLLFRPDLGNLRPIDFHRGDEAIAEGYRAARAGPETSGDRNPV